MNWLIGVCIFLAVVLSLALVRLFIIKRELNKIADELYLTRNRGYDRQITIPLIDDDLSAAVTEINKNLDYQKKMKLEQEQAERQMKQSISDIAHDLRTPLTVIKGNLQIMEKDSGLTERGRELLSICQSKSDTLKSMVDDFFELSVLESDHMPVSLQTVDITGFLMQFIIDHETVIRGQGLKPEFSFPERSIFISADEQLLSRMLGNLLNNVLKYARGSFKVELRTDDEGKCLITFSNRLTDSLRFDASRLFERSFRGDRARSGEGAGLGLYIVKLLAEKQGAVVRAESKDNQLKFILVFECVSC